ncbi:MAG: hypothetical protein RI920_1734, partial [Pseudomonadota bacterium]
CSREKTRREVNYDEAAALEALTS